MTSSSNKDTGGVQAPLSFSPSVRAEVITRRTYNRPLDDEGLTFETWEQTVDRVISHQRWLWERAKGWGLNTKQEYELEQLRLLMLRRQALPSGRALWMGGTEVGRTRESSLFNCSFGRVATVHDVVDAMWLLLQGCGVGFEPVVGTLSGFSKPVKLTVIRSKKTDIHDKGAEGNVETFTKDHFHQKESDWTIKLGDSAEAWAKVVGKLLANKRRCRSLTIDLSEIRPPGVRLRGYGWFSSGDEMIAKALEAIVTILNLRAGKLLTRIDILDIMNHLGTVLSSRRSAEIAVVPYGDPEWIEFAQAKKNHHEENPQRAQSNNSIIFYHKPSYAELTDIFHLILDGGGSEPGFINGTAALLRAPWFKGVNPCVEILLGDKSFCKHCSFRE